MLKKKKGDRSPHNDEVMGSHVSSCCAGGPLASRHWALPRR